MASDRSVAVARWLLIIARKWWCAWQELEVHVAAVGRLRDIVGGTPERLLSTNLASKLLVAIVSVGDVWLEHERFATIPAPGPHERNGGKVSRKRSGKEERRLLKQAP